MSWYTEAQVILRLGNKPENSETQNIWEQLATLNKKDAVERPVQNAEDPIGSRSTKSLYFHPLLWLLHSCSTFVSVISGSMTFCLLTSCPFS